ncbi:MAG TPA: hypothetical protein VMH83_09980, partial [Candidatus Acidoferrum sp.]|nr:hypothetical protein [Candidatus Acidoferrum sp.]
ARSNAVYWFRTHVAKPDKDALYGLYFYRYTKSLDLYFNGEYIGGDEYEPGWDTAAWNHPLLVTIQNANWRQGDNEVMVRLQGSRLGGVFAGIVFGEYDQLAGLRDDRAFMQVTINEWLLSFGFLVTALSLLLWCLRRSESLYWQFALVSSCWMLITYHMVTYMTPLPDRWWLPLVHVGIDGWIYALSLFLASWFGLQVPRQFALHRYLLAAAAIWHALAILPYWWMTAYLIHSVGVIFVMRLQYEAIRRASERRGQRLLLLLIITVQLVCYVHDIYTLMLAPDTTWRTAYHWSQFTFPLLQLIFLLALIQRFVSALTLAEGLNQQLETRVTQIRAELEQAYQRARSAERQQAAEDERTRIYRDLHDDVGSKLLSIAHAGRDTRLGGLASAALESLRDAVARVNNPEIRFDEFLRQLKEEMQLRLTSLGIVLGWWQPPAGLDWMLSSEQNYHLNRIFRELVSNIIRHAGATEVKFDVMQAGQTWRFLLADNGKGLAQQQPQGGGGSSLRARAGQLGASIAWNTRPEGGVLVVLELYAGPGPNTL